ncbi:MAG: NTP transferase domain-containing protein [Candidatus Cloacimonetes bacterium]|nr:NTP transferase domain-containing protein [Candidatus Cloacimonadota bacterium]
MIALIMAGGIGSRFWPLSRKKNPKQFLPIVSKESMIRLTVDRLLPKINVADIYVVTALEQAELVRKHLPELPTENIICEPFGMNTAPCIGLSLAWLEGKYPADETMLVAAADHQITNTSAFYECLQTAANAAQKGYLVTFGVLPDYPATCYGYIECGREIMENTIQVLRFKEKPKLAKARQYLQTGNFLWNSGMFLWQLQTIRRAYEELQPEIWNLMGQIRQSLDDNLPEQAIAALYAQMPKIPVDVGIMEKSTNIAVVPAGIGWSDVGGWKALAELSPADAEGNFCQNPLSQIIDSRNNYVFSDKMVSLIGVKNLIVVDTGDVLLIMNKKRSEDVKIIVNRLNEAGKEELL